MRLVGTLLTILCASALGCAPPADDESETDAPELRDGQFTYDRPEIGMMVTNGMSMCTATLVAPHVVVTAAHCVGYGTQDTTDKQGWFRIEKSETEHYDFDWDAFLSYGRGWGSDDVALLRLKTAVPDTIARPADIATETPRAEWVTIFGYGCSQRPGVFGGGGWDDHSQRKQKLAFEMGPIRKVCPGDSGGPTVRGSNGGVFRVSSRMFSVEFLGWGVPDAFGDVVKHRTQILDQITAWRR
jgi:hypothetical protein